LKRKGNCCYAFGHGIGSRQFSRAIRPDEMSIWQSRAGVYLI